MHSGGVAHPVRWDSLVVYSKKKVCSIHVNQNIGLLSTLLRRVVSAAQEDRENTQDSRAHLHQGMEDTSVWTAMRGEGRPTRPRPLPPHAHMQRLGLVHLVRVVEDVK